MVYHNIPPVFDKHSEILILGSFPSVKSREMQFFYGHSQNRFWKVIATIYDYPVPSDIPSKKKLLLDNRIALWDVIGSCEINGSSDSSIRNAVPNDIAALVEKTGISQIFANGATSYNMYNRFFLYSFGIDAVKLPSTSPANAAYSLDRLVSEWKSHLLSI